MQPVALTRQQALRIVVRSSKFLQRRPLLAKSLPTAWGFAFGDFLTQYFNRDKQRPYRHDFTKTALMAAAGASLAAPVGLGLYRWMDAAWPSAMLMVAAGKFTLDQVVGCVIWQAAYCAIPGNEWYREMLGGALRSAASGVDGGVRDAVAYAACHMSSVVLPAPAAC